MCSFKNYALFGITEKMNLLNAEISYAGKNYIDNVLLEGYTEKSSNYFIKSIKKMCLPNSIFTVSASSSAKLSEIYRETLTEEAIDNIKINTVYSLQKEISKNSTVDFSTLLSFYLIKHSLHFLLKVNLNESIKEFYFNNKDAYKNSLESSKKVIFLSILPIPRRVKFFFLKKKSYMNNVVDSMLDLIYKENSTTLEIFARDNDITKKELDALLNTIMVNMLTLSFSVCAMIILLLKNTKYIQEFIEDKNFSKRCYIETLRLFPPIVTLVKDFIKTSKCPFNRTKTIFFDLYKGQRQDSIENPNSFDPNRKIQPHLYFGIGQRKCIGKQFSISISTHIAQSLFKKYVIEYETLPKIQFFGKILSLDKDLVLTLKENNV